MITRIGDDGIDSIAFGKARGLCSRILGQLQTFEDALALLVGEMPQLRRLDVNYMPWHSQLCRDTCCAANDAVAAFARPDAGQQRFACLPHWRHKLVASILDHLAIHPVCGAAQSELT